jgi:sigma-B regulation protein RsbU (phosphoserine phosphatase)
VIGVLNVSNEEPIDYTAEDLKILTTLASQAVSVIENAIRHKSQIQEAMAHAELEKGRQIQRDFLPNQILQPPNWEIAACFYPARKVAGDFYDAFWLPGDCVGLVIGDVCDKGVGAALFMALFRSLIRVFSGQTQLRGLSLVANDEGIGGMIDLEGTIDLDHINALKAVALTNNYIAQEHAQMSMFATIFFGVLNPKTGFLSYISGGHVPLFLLGSTGVKETLNSTGPPVGIIPDTKFKIKQVQLEPGDILIGYTDGVTEGKDPNGKLFTDKRLRSLLEQPAASASDLLKRITTHLFAYMNDAPQFDDITILAVQRTPLK